jgi:transcription elongation factor Elf1
MAQIEANQGQDRRVASSYYCHNCNSSNCLTIQRRRIDNIRSIQFWSCSNCGFKWQDLWSSYGEDIWSLQYHSMQRPIVMMYKIC